MVGRFAWLLFGEASAFDTLSFSIGARAEVYKFMVYSSLLLAADKNLRFVNEMPSLSLSYCFFLSAKVLTIEKDGHMMVRQR